MNSSEILRRFGFEVKKEVESIYPFSTVFRIGNCIIKRTQSPIQQAHNLMQYLDYLHKSTIPVVTPKALTTANPQQIGEACFVCYPFIDGRKYQGTPEEIMQAGELFGKIHALATKENTFQLEKYQVFDFYHEEVDEHLQKITAFVAKYHVPVDVSFLHTCFHQAVNRQVMLEHATMHWIETPHDYKANNLIFQESPVLIDPDNAKWIPRCFDLALVLLLFHNELDSAPNRVFTPTEWQSFLRGYRKYQRISEEETQIWKDAVHHIFLDEVMWLMADVPEDWKRQEQRDLFVSITELMQSLDAYSLDIE